MAFSGVTLHIEKINGTWGSCFLCTALVVYGVSYSGVTSRLSPKHLCCTETHSCFLLRTPAGSALSSLHLGFNANIFFQFAPQYETAFTLVRLGVDSLQRLLLLPPFVLLGGHCLTQGWSPLPNSAAPLVLWIYISSPCNMNSFPSQTLYPRINSLGKTVMLPAWRGVWCISELLCLELRWRLQNGRPLPLSNSLWKGLRISSGRLKLVYKGRKELGARSPSI